MSEKRLKPYKPKREFKDTGFFRHVEREGKLYIYGYVLPNRLKEKRKSVELASTFSENIALNNSYDDYFYEIDLTKAKKIYIKEEEVETILKETKRVIDVIHKKEKKKEVITSVVADMVLP